jgi:hypothetical protein
MLTLLASVALAQSIPAPQVARHWEQYETEHYRVYYPTQAKDWAQVVAENLEPIRARVQAEVGTPMPERQVEILVQDPFSRPNGFALPLQNSPRMGIFASPPNSDSILGNYRSWHELLVVHEDAHLVHLLTPSRNPFVAAIQRQLFPMGPVARKSPRWVSEGYATVVEGRLTGSGRPNGDGRSTLLRAMAMDGQMPAYEELDGADRFMGGSMAYLVGSHYLEWLEAGRHPGALQELWRAMSAVEFRSFEDAFTMVFGDDPATLYARYLTELSHQALTIEASRTTLDTLWQDIPGYTGAPAVSPDGSHIALVLEDEDNPRLVIWSTAENTEAEESYQEAMAERLEKDPLDVTPLRTKPLSREPVHERVNLGRAAESPRWLPDGSGVVFTSWQTDTDGRQRPDLFLWTLEGEERRITHGAAVRDADVGPTGDYAIAVRERWAVSEIVRVDLATGQTITLRPGTAMTVFDSPRLSPDGTQLAYLRHQGAGWELMLYDMQTRQERSLPLPEGAQISSPEWSDSETLVASVGLHGFVEAWAIPVSGTPRRLTQTRGGALHPSPAPNGDLYFLSLSAQGLSLHLAEDAVPLTIWGLPKMGPEQPIDNAALLQRPPAPQAPPAPEKQPVTPNPYYLGPHDIRPLLGAGGNSGDGDFVELGLRAGDPAGRSTVQAMVGLQYASGASASWTVRVLPVDLGLWAWTLDKSQGLALVAEDRVFWASGAAEGGASLRADTAGNAAAAWGQVSHRQWLSQAWVQGEASARGQVQGESGGQAQGLLSAGWGGTGLRAGVGTAAGPEILVGGMASSLYTPGWDSWRLYDPAFSPGITADQVNSWEAGIGGGGLWLNTRWHELEGEQNDTLGSLALSVDVESPPQPFFRLSQSHIQLGVACILDPVGGEAKEELCRTKDDYSAWASITWSP